MPSLPSDSAVTKQEEQRGPKGKEITDSYMREMLQTMKSYTTVILHRTPKRDEPGADQIIWEHGRRNFELRREVTVCLVLPVVKDESDIAGVYVFSTDRSKTAKIMDGDPAVKAGIFTYETHMVQGFPGDALAK